MGEVGSMSLAFRLDSADWDHDGDRATLHLSGRWRRRPVGAVQPLLVIERAGARHRFPARPELPGLSAMAPGATRISFDVPAELVPEPGDRMWLGLGGVMVSLPVPGDPQDPAPAPAESARPARPAGHRDPSDRAERMALAAELAVLRAALAAVEAEPREEFRAQVQDLEADRQDLQQRLTEAEAALAAARAAQPVPVPAPETGRLGPVLDAIGEELTALREGLERERDRRSAAEVRAEAAEEELAASRRRASEAYMALEALRAELLGAVSGSEGAAAVAPVAPVTVSVAAAHAPPEPQTAGLDPSRFDAARSRLRTVPVDDTPASGWLARALRSLCATDPGAAGRLALALLPAQALWPDPVRYDLVLGDGGTLLVDVPGDRQPVTVRAADAPRAAGEVDFAFRGSLAALGRLVADGRLPGFLGRSRGRVSGRREAAAVLAGLGGQRVRLTALLAAGVVLDGQQALELTAHALDPALTRAERWTIAFAEPGRTGSRLLLRVGDGRRPAVLRAPLSVPAAAEVEVAEVDLAALLAGAPGVTATLSGDPGPLERVREWLVSAQSG